MGVCCVLLAFRTDEPTDIAPYFGTSADGVPTAATVLALSGRGLDGSNIQTFSLEAASDQYQYFAYPATYGPVIFYDNNSHFTGGWDGANDNPFNSGGPKVLSVAVAGKAYSFYVYRTDYPGLGACKWTTSAA